MIFDLLTKAARLLVGRRYTSYALGDTQEAFTSTIQMGANEVWAQTALIPTSSLPYSSSATPGSILTSSVLKYWYKFPLTVANDAGTGSAGSGSVWFFINPTGSVSGIGSQLIATGQQTDFISPKYIIPSLANQNADADYNGGGSTGYNIGLFTSPDNVTFTKLDPSASYQFDYKTGIVEFTTAVVPAYRLYATVYQYNGLYVSDVLLGISGSGTSSYFSGSLLSASNIYVAQTSSLNILTANTASFVYLSLNNTGSAPVNSTDIGSPGEIRLDNNFVYFYANGKWHRIPQSLWN
jgi:hypothetical protein